jgi:hypothetical protein
MVANSISWIQRTYRRMLRDKFGKLKKEIDKKNEK